MFVPLNETGTTILLLVLRTVPTRLKTKICEFIAHALFAPKGQRQFISPTVHRNLRISCLPVENILLNRVHYPTLE
jgi:hypothetical protein